jgi:hypothetical protein
VRDVCKSTARPDDVVAYHEKTMDEKGWLIIAPPGGSGLDHGYMKDGVMFTLATGRAVDGSPLVSIGEMAAQAR